MKKNYILLDAVEEDNILVLDDLFTSITTTDDEVPEGQGSFDRTFDFSFE